MSITIKATVDIKGQQDLRAVVDDLQELERFDQSTFSFKLHPEGAPAPLFLQNIRARPIHDIVREVLARSDAVRSSWYRSPPRGQPFPERVRAGTASIREQQRELAMALMREGAPHALTSRTALHTHYAHEIKQRFGGPINSRIIR
jgi:hypothetical protein